MAYSSSNVRMILELGFASGGSMYLHSSSDPSTDIAATGFFAGAGAGGKPLLSDSAKMLGMKYGDIVLHRESSGGATPGRMTMHSVVGSTANQASTLASTGFNTLYDVTVSSAATT